MPLLRRLTLVLALLALPLAALGQSTSVEGDPDSFRQVIQQQLDAFQRDDGVAAFAQASPMIKGLFRTPERFMQMVIGGYPQVYRPRTVNFGGTTQLHGQPTQIVYLTGPDGEAVIAFYQMQQQPDGTWKINGVHLEPAANV